MKAYLSPGGTEENLLAKVPARAAALRAAHARGTRFLVVPVTDNRDAAAWAIACFHAPVAFVPVPADLPAPALERRLRQLPGGASLPDSLPSVTADPLSPRDPSDIWAVIFSSGTTGEPKGVALTGSALEAAARAHGEHSDAAGATWLLDLPLHHVGGLSVLTRAYFLQAPVALGAPRFSAPATAAWIRSGLVQGLSLVPTTLKRLLEEPALDFSPLSLAFVGGAAAEPALVSRARSRGVPVRLTYGMTETASQLATERAPGTGLFPLPGVELRFADEEILVRSPALAAGYFREGVLEPLPSRDGFFPTGDLGALADGALSVRGRRSDVIVSGGKKIHPLGVEAELAKLDEVTDCGLVALPDPEWGELVCAAVVEKSGGAFDAGRAKEHLLARIEKHEIPRRWVVVREIPRTPSGKVLRAELRAAVEEALKSSRS